ncbi:MAG: hypothetical protein H0X25_15990 [Acidobacteriales bacterium]|nr:hypothetical protein [Terriglobales bacterium]
MAAAAISADFVDVIAREISQATNYAVEAWLAEIEAALDSTKLSHMGRLRAVREIIERYKRLAGKHELQPRNHSLCPSSNL